MLLGANGDVYFGFNQALVLVGRVDLNRQMWVYGEGVRVRQTVSCAFALPCN
jgi:hypothetical protein